LQSVLLQPWTTIRCTATGGVGGVTSFTQDDEGWLDLADYADALFWVDVTDVTPSSSSTPIQLILQTSPTRDEPYFAAVAPPLNLTVGLGQVVRSVNAPSTSPFARFTRWTLRFVGGSAASWGATFRIRVSASKQPNFVPTRLPGCFLWLRADLGVTLSSAGTVSNWNDQSGTNDPNKNLAQTQTVPTNLQPAYHLQTAAFNNQPTLQFTNGTTNTFMTSSGWATAIAQPNTWIVVAQNTSGAATQDVMDGDDNSHGQVVQATSGGTPSVAIYAGTTLGAAGQSWASASALLAEFNGGLSQIFFGSGGFTTAAATGAAGSAGCASMTLGSHSQVFGGGNYWDGYVAEIIGYNRVLSNSDKAAIRSYLNGRYALAIS
jgi:hypothetical protein